jgi:hypothetical protein
MGLDLDCQLPSFDKPSPTEERLCRLACSRHRSPRRARRWGAGFGLGMEGVLAGLVLYFCAGCTPAEGPRRPEPEYERAPLPQWQAPTAEPTAFDEALLEGEVVPDEPTEEKAAGGGGAAEEDASGPGDPGPLEDAAASPAESSSTAASAQEGAGEPTQPEGAHPPVPEPKGGQQPAAESTGLEAGSPPRKPSAD